MPQAVARKVNRTQGGSRAALRVLEAHVDKLRNCQLCPQMVRPVVTGNAVLSPVMLIGQAPGAKEGVYGKPFAWTAGKTMFRWFGEIGLDEEGFRERIYMAAVCRCFPGKNPKGGDRVPDADEIARCAGWLEAEFELVQPKLIIPVGKLAISQLLEVQQLAEVVGRVHRSERVPGSDLIPLPHPSGASTWHRTEPGRTLLARALKLIKQHPAFRQVVEGA